MEDEWEKELARFDDETLVITPVVWDDQGDAPAPMEEEAVHTEDPDGHHAMCEEEPVKTPPDAPTSAKDTQPVEHETVEDTRQDHESTTLRGATPVKAQKRTPARVVVPVKKPSIARQTPPTKKPRAAGRRGPKGKKPGVVPDV